MLHEGPGSEFDGLVAATHALESGCDDLRGAIERTLYGRALLPESRGDILGLLESLDLIPNKAESVLFQIQLQRMTIPEDLKEDFKRLIGVNVDAYGVLRSSIETLFERPADALRMTEEVDKEESESDSIERILIRRIFKSSLPGEQKILLKELVIEIGELSDRAENVADRVALVSIKRRV